MCAIHLGIDSDVVEREVSGGFPNQTLVVDQPGLRDDVARVVECITSPQRGLDLPLDTRHGTRSSVRCGSLCEPFVLVIPSASSKS